MIIANESSPTMTTEDFETLLSKFIMDIQSNVDAYYAKNYPRLTPEKIFAKPGGKRYVKVVKGTPGTDGKSVFCFVERSTGDVYKAASWKAPAKGIRGNIRNPAESSCTVYGAKYAR